MNNATGDGEAEVTGVEQERQRHRRSKPLLSLGLSFPMWSMRHVGDALSSIAQSCPTLGDPTDCSTPGFPVHHNQPLELAHTQVHRVSDAIQPSQPLLLPAGERLWGLLLEERGGGRDGKAGRSQTHQPGSQAAATEQVPAGLYLHILVALSTDLAELKRGVHGPV